MIIEVLEVLEGDRVIVSTKGLMRVHVPETGEYIDELVTPEEAKWSARGWNALGEPLAKPVRYSA